MFGRSEDRLTGKYFGYPIVIGKATEIEVLSSDKGPIVAEMRVAEIEWDGEPAKTLAQLRCRSEGTFFSFHFESLKLTALY